MSYRKEENKFMANLIEGGPKITESSLDILQEEVANNRKAGPRRQGSVDHFKIKPGERTSEKPKITKVLQVMGGKEQNLELVVYDVRKGRVVEELKKPVKPHPGETRVSLRVGK